MPRRQAVEREERNVGWPVRAGLAAAGSITATYPAEARASFGHNPMRRLAAVWDVAQGTVYLASSAVGFITGTTLALTGGE
ncbi:MAG: hypothetical protein ACFCVK_04570 [Acidimicrobiales bacterium]